MLNYLVSAEGVAAMKKRAAEAAIEAEITEKLWREYAIRYARWQLLEHFKTYHPEGLLSFSDGDELVRVTGMSFDYGGEPRVEYLAKLRSGKWSKPRHVFMSYFLDWFKQANDNTEAQ